MIPAGESAPGNGSCFRTKNESMIHVTRALLHLDGTPLRCILPATLPLLRLLLHHDLALMAGCTVYTHTLPNIFHIHVYLPMAAYMAACIWLLLHMAAFMAMAIPWLQPHMAAYTYTYCVFYTYTYGCIRVFHRVFHIHIHLSIHYTFYMLLLHCSYHTCYYCGSSYTYFDTYLYLLSVSLCCSVVCFCAVAIPYIYGYLLLCIHGCCWLLHVVHMPLLLCMAVLVYGVHAACVHVHVCA